MLLHLLSLALTLPPSMPQVIPLPTSTPAPTTAPDRMSERGSPEHANRSVTTVNNPSVTIYLPPNTEAGTPAAIICPGGGYSSLAIDHEGHDVARWLNSLGIAGIVLKYRLPHGTPNGTEPLPLQDAHAAISLVRARAAEWHIDPHRVGIIGFSAGGHLASSAITHFTPDTRPDFAILGYPVISMREGFTHSGSRTCLLGPTPDPTMEALYSNDEQVSDQTPPSFLVHAKDDRAVPIANSERFAAACKSHHVPVELHEFDHGGHGFGLGKGESEAWPGLAAAWLKSLGVLGR